MKTVYCNSTMYKWNKAGKRLFTRLQYDGYPMEEVNSITMRFRTSTRFIIEFNQYHDYRILKIN